jgi:two-component system, OmpR family, sensor kinase
MSASLDSDRLAVLVHEVRSPVAALSAIAETIADDALDLEARRSLVKLVTLACRGIERIVADASVVSIRLEPIDPVELVGDVVSAARLRGAEVELTAAARVPRVAGDPSRLRQVLDNLIVNALVHGGAREPVSVTVRVDSMVRIDVSDLGPGIPEEHLQRIFEPGVRLDPEVSAGTGLGLALGRAIAEGHGGSLTATSAPGAGATFTLALPMRMD